MSEVVILRIDRGKIVDKVDIFGKFGCAAAREVGRSCTKKKDGGSRVELEAPMFADIAILGSVAGNPSLRSRFTQLAFDYTLTFHIDSRNSSIALIK